MKNWHASWQVSTPRWKIGTSFCTLTHQVETFARRMPHWHFIHTLARKNEKLAHFRHVVMQARWHVNYTGTQVRWYVEHVGRMARDLANSVHFYTPVLLSCSLHSCVNLACTFECVFVFELAARILDKF